MDRVGARLGRSITRGLLITAHQLCRVSSYAQTKHYRQIAAAYAEASEDLPGVVRFTNAWLISGHAWVVSEEKQPSIAVMSSARCCADAYELLTF